MPDLHEPPEWSDVAARITHESVRRVMVIGAADVGKSTFCRFLFRTARAGGRTTALLDTDVGQKTVGPPACVTLAEGNSSKLAFVGTTDPVQGWRRVVDGARRLAHEVDSDLLVVNTGGLVGGPGRRFKADMIAAIRPDLLIAIGVGSDLEHIIADHPNVPALRLTRSPAARRKTKAARRSARQEAFRKYFEGAAVRVFSCGLVPEALHYRLGTGVLVGLSDRPGTDLGLGILLGEPRSSMLEVLAHLADGDIRQVTPGSVRLREDFSDLRSRLQEQL
jgi:polynucleotide 5'-hydroxyl-kinase GRC3/NOL9